MIVATVGKVIEVNPIKDADRIESLTVVCGKLGKWVGTAQKQQFVVGDIVNVYLQDALLPHTEEFSFMEKHGFRVKMARFRGVPSEVLIMPLKYGSEIGEDVMRLASVEKYEKPISPSIAGDVYGNFPSFIPKTDEPNFQSVPHLVDAMRGKQCYSTIKCDGTSMTVYMKDGHFGVCSRNLELKDSPVNTLWSLARKYKLDEVLQKYPDTAIQMEVVGPSINKNTMKLKEPDIRVFNVYDIDGRCYLNGRSVAEICNDNGLPFVPVLQWDFLLNGDTSDEQFRVMAQHKYECGANAEGIVIRPMKEDWVMGERVSVKVINLNYKD